MKKAKEWCACVSSEKYSWEDTIKVNTIIHNIQPGNRGSPLFLNPRTMSMQSLTKLHFLYSLISVMYVCAYTFR